VTLAPADDGLLTVNLHALMAIEVMRVTNGVVAVDDAVASANAVGVDEFGFGQTLVTSSSVASIWKFEPPVEFA
jgi:hypothetical protein